MEVIKEIKKFNDNPSYDKYVEIIDNIFPNRHKCNICDKDIFYENIKFRIKRSGDIVILGNSFMTSKKHGHKLKVCERCIRHKFPKYDMLNKGKIFNTSNELTIYAFNLSNNDKSLYKTGVTLNRLVQKYGEEEGNKKWKDYLDKQSKTNTFEYKKQKYGWSETEFRKYNKSRGITLSNLIKKYGEEEGNKKWKDYLDKQSKTKSYIYMVKKFGKEKADKINKSKGLTLINFQRKYGVKEGFNKFNIYIKKHQSFYSNISQELFIKIDNLLNGRYTTYYATKNNEYGVMTGIGYKKLDYYIKELNICIEFNGDLFHANPLFFSEFDTPNPFNQNLTAKQIWENDSHRQKTLLQEHNIKTIVIWEDDYKKNDFNLEKILIDNGILF
jgi:hypothetical protein